MMENKEGYILIDLILSLVLLLFGIILLVIIVRKYKVKTFYDIKGLGVAIVSIIAGIYLLVKAIL